MKWIGLRDAVARAQVTSARSRVMDPVTGARRRLSGQSELRWELHWAQDFPTQKLNWGVDAFYASAYRTFRPFGDQYVGGWLHANVFVEYRAGKQTALRAEVQNLPGERVSSSQYYYSGLKGLSPLTRLDEWRLSVGPILYLRLRRTVT
jgi:outer membrane receptor for ferrienterochelin and colicins